MPVILDTWEAEIGINMEAIQGKKLMRPNLNQQLGVGASTCHPSYVEKYISQLRPAVL
jgi:hypothetical protein